MGDKTIKRGVSKAAIRKWNEQSYEAEKARYDFAMEEFQRLKKEREQEEAKRKAILAEREAQEEAARQAKNKEEEIERLSSDNNVANQNTTSEKIQLSKDKENINKQKDGQSFWTSLWMGLTSNLFSNPITIGVQTPAVYENTKTDIEKRDRTQEVFWTKDAVSAYNIQKNKVEVEKYVGDIVANKEKLQYADVINTYTDNVRDYLSLRQQYDMLLSDNTLEGRSKRAEIAGRINTLKKWIDDLDESMKIATSYDLSYGNPLSQITSYEASIGAPRNSGHNLQEDGKSIYNQYKQISSKNNLTQFDISSINQTINRVKSSVDRFGKKIDEDNIIASKKMDEEYKDLKEWEDWHTPSAEFRAKEKAAQSNYLFDWDTYAYAFPGTLGSSMSFGGTQMLSTALNMIGGVAIQTGNPYAVAGGVVSTIAGAGLGIVSGLNENKSEVGSNYTDAVRKDLENRGLLDDFIKKGEAQLKKKGLFYHGDDESKIEDILNYFVRGDIQYNDQKINDVATKHLFGANNLFQNDMMAVSADVAFDTGLNLFLPAGSVAKALKIAPVGKFNNYTRTLAQISKEHPLIGTFIRKAGSVESGVGTRVLDAISPVAGASYRTAKAIIPGLNKIHAGAEAFAGGMKKAVKNLTSFITDAPASTFKLNTVGKGFLTFGGMSLMRGFSEAIEEGKQYKYGERFKNGGFAGKSNSILETLADDFSTGTSAALAFLGSQFLGIESDSELMSNMRGGFVGGILNHGSLITAYQQANNTSGEMKMGDLLMQNLMYQRIQERGEMLNGVQFAKYATNPNKVAQMNAAFDRMIDISENYQEKAESDPTQSYWTKEDIESQRELFNRVVSVANNGIIQASIKNQGIDIDSERGNALVSMISYGLHKAEEDNKINNEHIQQFNQLLEQDRLVSDQLGNIRSILENIESIDDNEGLTKQEIEYLKSVYDEAIDADEKAKPHASKKLNSRQRRKADAEYRKNRLDRITDKIKQRIENDKNIDAAFAKQHALLRLKNELESIPEEMRSRTQKNQLKSVQYQLDKFMNSLTPMQKMLHGIQTEDTLAELGKNRGFFQQMSAAFRTIALDNASTMQDEAFLSGLLGKDARLLMSNISATNILLTENKQDKDLLKELLSNIAEAAKDKNTFEASRDALIDSYLKSVKDDYQLFEQIRDNFQDAAEFLDTADENDAKLQAEHTRTVTENPQPQQPAMSFDSAQRMLDEETRRKNRREKRKRNKENRRIRAQRTQMINDYMDQYQDAWEEPELDAMIAEYEDPADWDEINNGSKEEPTGGSLDDYLAQYQDAWEEPWWDELVGEREAALAEEAAFLEHYSSSNDVIMRRKLEVESLMQKYKIGTVVSGQINEKRVSFAVIGQIYDPHTDKLTFALQRLKIDAMPDRRYKTILVSENEIKQYTNTGLQTQLQFGEQPKSVNGITVGDTYNIIHESNGYYCINANVEVIDIDDQLNVHFKTSLGIPSSAPIDLFKQYINNYKNTIGSFGVPIDEEGLAKIASIVYSITDAFGDVSTINIDEIYKNVTGLYITYLQNKNRVTSSNLVDSFIEENGVLVRKTKASYAIGDIAVDNKVEAARKTAIVALFSSNGINNTEHTLRQLEGWYNNTLSEDETDIIKFLGKPVDSQGNPLHTNKIDLSPYITLFKQGHFGTIEIDHVAHIISREYDRPAISEQEQLNDIINKIVRHEDVEQSQFTDDVVDILNSLKQQGLYVISMPMQIVGEEYTYENNLFVIDSLGNVRSLFFPVRKYDYNQRIDERRSFPETNRQLSSRPISYNRQSVMTEREWQDRFAKLTSSIILEYAVPSYKGTYQIPIQSDKGVISISDKHITFDQDGVKIQALDKSELSKQMRSITTLVERATKMLNENKNILPFTQCVEMLDFCDAIVKKFQPNTTTKEEVDSAKYYLEQAIVYMSVIIDDYHRQNDPAPQRPIVKPSGKVNTKAEKMLPVIRADVERTQELVNNIHQYTRNGGYIQKQVRDTLEAFVKNDSMERYEEKLRGSSIDSDKQLADTLSQLRSIVSQILGSYPNTIGSEYRVDPNTPKLQDNVLVLSDLDRLSLGDILTRPDFANTCSIELVYGIYDKLHNVFTKQERKTNSYGAGVYAIISYGEKTYNPISVQPSHYTDRFNSLTDEGNAFVDSVIAQQAVGKVFASDVHRLLPNINYNGNFVPVTLNSVLKLTDQDLQRLTPQSSNIGMCKTEGKVFPLDSTNTIPLATLNSSVASRNIGGIFYMLPFNFEEYQDGSSVVPVRLLNKPLKDGDIDVILQILKDLKEQYDVTNILNLDKPYVGKNGNTPFTNLQVLQFLSNFTQNEQKCRIFINPDGTIKMRMSTSSQFGQNINPATIQGQEQIRNFFKQSAPYVFNHIKMLSGKLSNVHDPLYKNLSAYIQNNRILSISPSLVFDEDDISMNGEGFYGIGWAMRHGRLITNAGYVYEPSVGIGGVETYENSIQGQYNPQPTSLPQQPQAPVDNGMAWLEQFINNAKNDEGTVYAPSTVVSTNKKLDKEQAIKNIHRMLGEEFPIEIQDKILTVLSSGANVLGQCYVDSIVLSSQAVHGTEYHEAFHRIVELLLPSKVRDKIYKLYVQQHPQLALSSNTADIAEHMAESFRIWMTEYKPDTFKFTWNIVKLFKQVKQWVNAIKRIGSLRLAYVYYKINTGAYANIKPSQDNITRFVSVFGNYAPMTIYNPVTEQNVNLKKFTSISDYNAGIETISRMIINEYLKADNTIEVQDIDLSIDGIKSMTGYQYLIGNNEKTAANEAFIELFDNWDNIKSEVIDKLKVLGIGIRQNKATGKITIAKSSLDSGLESEKETDDDNPTNEGAVAEMMDYISKESYEISKVKKIKDFIKFLLSSLEDTHYVEEGEVDDNGKQIELYTFDQINGRYVDEDGDNPVWRNGRWECDKADGTTLVGNQIKFKKHRNIITSTNVFGFKKYLPFDEVYSKLLADCHSVNTISDLISLLQKKAQTDLMYKQLYDKIINAYNNLYYVDKDGFHRDVNGGLWRLITPKDTGVPTLLKVDSDTKTPVQLTEEIAKETSNWINVNGKYFLAMPFDKVDKQYDWNNVSLITQLFNAISGSKLNYKMVIASRDSQSSMTYRVSDTDSGYTARKFVQQWYLSFISNRQKIDAIEHNGILYHRTKDPNLFNRAHEFFATVVNAFVNPKGPTSRTGNFVYNGHQYNVYTNTDVIKRMIVQTFNSIGVSIDKKTFDHMLFSTFGDTGYHGLVRYFSQNGDISRNVKGVNMELFLKSIVNCQKDGIFQPSLESGAFFMKNGVITQLADAKYSYNTVHKQLMVNAPGNNKYYVMSEKNSITFMTELLSDKDGKTVQDFVNCPYYTYVDPITGVSESTFVLENVLSGEYQLMFDNFVGFKNEDLRGDAGSDYMQISDPVDLISKITLLEDNYMIFPVMSNKKTYGAIYLVDKNGARKQLPGIEFVSNINDKDHKPYRANNVPTLVANVHESKYVPNGKYSNYSFVFPDEVYDRLIKYAFTEYQTVKYGIKTVQEMSEDEKVDNLHKPNKKTKQSSAGICRFPRFYGVYVPEIIKDTEGNITAVNRTFINFNDNKKTDQQNLETAEKYFFGQNVTNIERKAMINELLMIQLEKWLNYLETNGIIHKRQGWRSIENPFLRYESDVLDRNLINSIVLSQQDNINGMKLSSSQARSLAIVQLLMDAHIKHQISMEEIQRLYLGHPGEFETYYDKESGRIVDDEKDLSKRAGGQASTGETNALGVMGLPTEYVCSEMDDYKVSSPQYEDIKKAFDESEHRSTLFNTKVKQIDTVLSNMRITSDDYENDTMLYETMQKLEEILGIKSEQEWPECLSDLHENIRNLLNSELDKPYNKNQELANIRSSAKTHICTYVYNEQKDLSLEKVSEQLEEMGLLSGVQARVGAYASAYEEGINVGDGASYISPKMCKNMLIQLGLFKGKVVKAFEYLEKGISKDVLADAQACQIIMEAMLGSQKYTAYGYRMNHGFPEFYYNKTALFPMFRQLCVTPKLKGIYDMMTKGDEPVDMLMFKSSVKVGSRGSQAIPEFSSDFDNFKPNTYKQSFRFLIKQLNTDPKDREKMAMGTQALKVIESILNTYVTDYHRRESDGTLSNTNIVSGIELRNEIMNCRKQIANLQISKVLERFFDESGAKNEKEFVKWIKDALTERDASTDMLRALQLNEDGTRKTKLGGMSDGGWVQSIATTLINKECIDLNLPGNMFIQRSVFGMEGRIVADKYVPSINGGERLKLVNEQGSMDAVISIDYFVELFPQLKGKSFKQQRDWLLQKKIIGKDAKALCVSYRIPTQAASSISALRFVDVLPIVRDTIVLPEEFTALTGSDFDIDKLFFSMKNLYEKEDGSISDEYERGTLEYYQNLLLEDFIMLLQQDRNKVGNITLRSIDNDTELGKSVARELTASSDPVDPYDALSLWRQSQIKGQNRTGGEAVGPSALNNSSQNIGRLYDLHLANNGVVRQLGISDLSSDLDIDSQSVLGMLGAYINGAVDNAKDPWITIVGINSYTYNLVNTLARAGFGRNSLYFSAQPVVKEMAKIYAYSQSTLFRDKQQTPFEVQEQLIEDFEKEYFLNAQGGISAEVEKIIKYMNSPMARYIEQYQSFNIGEKQEEQYKLINRSYAIIKAIIGIDHKDPHKKLTGFKRADGTDAEGSIMRDVAIMYSMKDTAEALKDHTKRYQISIKYDDINGEVEETLTLSPNEVELYMYILDQLLDYPSKAVSNSVQYTKIDTKKQGKNTAEQFAFLDGYENLKNSKAFDWSLFNMLAYSYIDTLTTKTIQLHQKMLSDEYIEAMDPMISFYDYNWVRQFLDSCGAKVNAESVKAAVDGISSYIKYKYIQDYATQMRIQIKDLFVGENSIYNQLNEIKTAILENPVLYKEYVDGDGNINNALIDSLEPSWIREKDFSDVRNAPKFVEVVNKDEDTGNSVNTLRMAWEQMLNDDKHRDIQTFAKRLIVYGFVTSGDISKPNTLFKYVPFSWRYEGSKNDGMEKSYSQYITDFITDKNEEHAVAVANKQEFAIPILAERRNDTVYDEILLNNWNNPKLVPTLPENKHNKKYYKTLSLDEKQNPDILIAAEMGIAQNANGVVQHVIRRSSVQGSPRIVKVHKQGHVGYNQEDFYFYRLYNHGTSVDRYGNVFTYPIYTLINPRGGIFYGNKILEYMTVQGFDWNNRGEFVDESKLADVEKIISVWNSGIQVEPPAGTNKRDWERLYANSYLTQDSIGADENSILTLLTASMALYDSFRRPVKKYTSDKYENDVEKAGSKISYSNGEVSREEMINNPRTLYIFTDNTNRTSGRNAINRSSKYYKRYGDNQTDLFYPNSTRAVARGLDNAMPISTQRFYDPKRGLVRETGRWTNADIEQFRSVVDAEFNDIEFEWASGNYDKIVILGGNDGLFNADISDIREDGDRSEIYAYLKSKLDGLFQIVDGVSNTEQYYYPGKPTLNAVPNWSPGSIYYAGVGSEETPQEVLDNMTALASELEKEGYVLRSGGAVGADQAFSKGVSNIKNKKIYFDSDIEHDVYGTAKQADKILEETHPKIDKIKKGTRSRNLLARDGYQVFGERFDSPAAFIICWTNDGATSYEQTSATTGGTGQAIRLGSRKGIPVINMADPNWRQKLDDVLQKNKPQETLEVWYGNNGTGPNANLSNMAERQFVLSDVTAQRINEIFQSQGEGISVSDIVREQMNGRKFHGVEQAFHMVKLAALYIHVREQDVQRRMRKNATAEEIERNNQIQFTQEDKTTILDNIHFAMRQVANAKTNKEAKQYGSKKLADVYGIIDDFFNGIWNNKDGKPDPTTGSYKAMGLLQIDSFQQNEKAANKLVNTGNVRFTHTKGGDWATAFPQTLTVTRNYIRNHPVNSAPPIRTELVIADSSSKADMDRAAAAVGGVITTRQKEEKFHFGNPFSHNPNWGIVVGDGTIEDAVKAFDSWLAGTEHQDVEPERRQWILDMINSGMLDDTPLVYYTSNATDKTGTHAYNYNTFPNHAHILLKYINMHIANPMNSIEQFASPLEAKATLESKKTILTNEELADWNAQGITNPRILVASEHTDPAFFADQIVDIVEGRKVAAGYGPTANKYTGKDFNALYIITKHDGAPIRKILQTKIPKIIHFSITGLGGTVWEPHSMKYTQMLDRIQSLIKDGLDPKCVTVRIDPIVPGVTLMSDVEEIIKRSSEMGIKRIKFSVCDMYKGSTVRMPDGRTRVKPAAWVPALERTEQQQGKEARDALWNALVQAYGTVPGKPNILNFNAYPERIYSICDRVVQIGEKYGVRLSTCAESINHPKVSKEGCLSVSQVNDILGTSIEDKGTANNNFRTSCTCFGGKVDALAYTDDCNTICGYCYAGHAYDDVVQQKIDETKEDKKILAFDKEALKQMGAEVLKHCNKYI